MQKLKKQTDVYNVVIPNLVKFVQMDDILIKITFVKNFRNRAPSLYAIQIKLKFVENVQVDIDLQLMLKILKSLIVQYAKEKIVIPALILYVQYAFQAIFQKTILAINVQTDVHYVTRQCAQVVVMNFFQKIKNAYHVSQDACNATRLTAVICVNKILF